MLQYLKQVFSNFSFGIVPQCLIHSKDRYVKMNEIIKPPETVRGQTVLEKRAFEKELEIPVIIVTKALLSQILVHIKKYVFKMQNIKPVQNVYENYTEVYLNPFDIKQFSSFPPEVQNKLKARNITEENFKMKKLTVYYENFTAEAVLRAVLPIDKEGKI